MGEECGTELLKKMLRIADDPSTPVSPRSTSQQVLPLHQHIMKQVSIEEMFQVRHSCSHNWLENLLSLIV
jgi:hypothetical protein